MVLSLDLQYLRGKSIAYVGPMNGGKTERAVRLFERALHSGYRFELFQHNVNDRDNNQVVINGQNPTFIAHQVNGCLEIMNIITSLAPRDSLTYKDETYALNPTLRFIGIEEGNYFFGKRQEVRAMKTLQEYCRSQDIGIVMTSLLYNFRHEPFGYVSDVLAHIDHIEYVKPVCKGYRGDERCTNVAQRTQRILLPSLARELHLEDKLPLIQVANKNNGVVEGYPAPIFDPTIYSEKAGDEQRMYAPVCHSCFQLPFEDKLDQLSTKILEQNGFDARDSDPITQSLLHYLCAELNIVTKIDDLYVPTPIYMASDGNRYPVRHI